MSAKLTADRDPPTVYRRCMLCRVVRRAALFQSCPQCGMQRCGECDQSARCYCGARRGCTGCDGGDRPLSS